MTPQQADILLAYTKAAFDPSTPPDVAMMLDTIPAGDPDIKKIIKAKKALEEAQRKIHNILVDAANKGGSRVRNAPRYVCIVTRG